MKRQRLKTQFRKNFNNWLLLALTLVSILLFTALKPSFFSVNSFSSVAKQAPEIGLFTLAMMLPMLVGGIDLSIIASANLSAILMTLYMKNALEAGASTGLSIAVAVGICMAVCIAVGFINGVVIACFKIPAMLVTLGMQMMLTGLSLGITKGGTLSGYPKAFSAIGNGTLLGIPTQFYIFLTGVLVLIIVMQKTSFGVKLTMYGSNKVSAVFSGIREKTLLIKTHMLSGAYVGLAAIIMTSRLNSASAGTAASYLMRAILIAVLGGVDPNGGSGKVSGVLLSVVLFQTIATGLNIMKVNSYVVIALYGVLLLFAVVVRRRKAE